MDGKGRVERAMDEVAGEVRVHVGHAALVP